MLSIHAALRFPMLAAENEKDQAKSSECQMNGTEAEDLAEEDMLEVQDKPTEQREARGAKADRLHLHSRQSKSPARRKTSLD